MAKYFGVNVREKEDGLKLNRSNFVDITKFKSKPSYYTDEVIENTQLLALLNLDLNMKYFDTLEKIEFKNEIENFVAKNEFVQVENLNEFADLNGYYLMVLDEYAQVYIGISNNIKKRIMSHWSKTMGLDRLIFGDANKSKIAIDSFRAFDTTRIYVKVTDNNYASEDDYINSISDKYYLNRTAGGIFEGGFAEAMANAKAETLPSVKDINEIYSEIKALQDKRTELMKDFRNSLPKETKDRRTSNKITKSTCNSKKRYRSKNKKMTFTQSIIFILMMPIIYFLLYVFLGTLR